MLVLNVSGNPVEPVDCVNVGGTYFVSSAVVPYSRSRMFEMTPAVSYLSVPLVVLRVVGLVVVSGLAAVVVVVAGSDAVVVG